MKNPKVLFKFSGILSYSIISTSINSRGIILANSFIRVSRKIDDTLVPVSQNFTETKPFPILSTTANRPQIDSSSIVFNFCHSPQNCTCNNIVYIIEASSILTIKPNVSPPDALLTITGSLYNNELLTMAYDCEY